MPSVAPKRTIAKYLNVQLPSNSLLTAQHVIKPVKDAPFVKPWISWFASMLKFVKCLWRSAARCLTVIKCD